MTDHEKNLSDQALEEALAQMAEEVPPMPADFHEKWTKAVRAEAANTENEAKTKSEPEKDNNNRIILINRWTRILSIAAVFVFLIGGTLIYRSSRPMVTMEQTVGEKREETAGAAEKPAQEDAGAGAFDMEEAPEEESEAIEAPAAETYGAKTEENAAMEAAEAEAPMLNMAAAGEAKNKTAGQMDMAAEEAADAEEPMYDAAVPMPTVHLTPEPTPEPTQEPVPESTATVTAIPETEAAAAEKKESPGFGQTVGDFFRDMGSFLLVVWPYLLILAVPAAAALVWRHRKKR